MGRKKKDISQDPRYENITNQEVNKYYELFKIKYAKHEAEIHGAGFDTYWENITGETEIISKEEFRDAYYTERNDILTKNMEKGAFDFETGGYIEPTPNNVIDQVVRGMMQRFGEDTANKYVQDAYNYYGLIISKEDLMYHTEQARQFWDLVKADQEKQYLEQRRLGKSQKEARKEAGRIISAQIFGSI